MLPADRRGVVRGALLVFALSIALPAAGYDPWESLNRKTQSFNDAADRLILKPVAKGYVKVVPGPARTGIGNFFGNLREVRNLVNALLQGKIVHAASDTTRLLVNSSIGIGGILDPASRLGLVRHQEDFGQTLAKWGVPAGPYVVLPLLGPSTLRDAIARPADSRMNPIRRLDHVPTRNTLYATDRVHGRASLLVAESAVFGDRYLFFREGYLQRRAFLISDGEVADDFVDDFGDEEYEDFEEVEEFED